MCVSVCVRVPRCLFLLPPSSSQLTFVSLALLLCTGPATARAATAGRGPLHSGSLRNKLMGSEMPEKEADLYFFLKISSMLPSLLKLTRRKRELVPPISATSPLCDIVICSGIGFGYCCREQARALLLRVH